MEPSTATLRSRTSTLSLGSWLEPALVGLAGLLLASVVAASDGGYFSDSWAWLAFVSLCVATLRLILVPALPLRRLDWAFVGGLAAFAAWVALSILWAPAATPSVDETIRDVSYAAVVLALLLVVRRRTVEALLVGALAGRDGDLELLAADPPPSRLGRQLGSRRPLFRLSGPIGYWNGLGLYAAMGVLLALGLVARSQSRIVQALAGAAPVLLVPTMLFTFSRGAWLALAVGLAGGDRCSTHAGCSSSPPSSCSRPGPPSVLAARAAVRPPDEEQRSRCSRPPTRAARCSSGSSCSRSSPRSPPSASGWSAPACTCPAPCEAGDRRAALARRRARGGRGASPSYGAAVDARPPRRRLVQRRAEADGNDVTGRLFDLSSNGRVEQWRVSVDQFREHPVVGDGAGSYAAAWNLRRPDRGRRPATRTASTSRCSASSASSGSRCSCWRSAVPLVAAVRARRQPLVTGAFAAYAAFLAHAAVDWDWELAGVTLVALIAAVALVVSARGDDEDAAPRRAVRVALPAVTGGPGAARARGGAGDGAAQPGARGLQPARLRGGGHPGAEGVRLGAVVVGGARHPRPLPARAGQARQGARVLREGRREEPERLGAVARPRRGLAAGAGPGRACVARWR